jgi:methyltransferase (TIGR00027 family)
MAQTNSIKQTALVMAKFRSDEAGIAQSLFNDNWSSLYVSESVREAAQAIEASNPGLKELVRLRTRYFDDSLVQAIRQGCKQVLILGGGYDTRALRFKTSSVKFFEVDQIEVLEFKSSLLKLHHVNSNAIYVPGDYRDEDFMEYLISNDFDPSLPTHAIWEGNTMHLSQGEIHNVLRTLGEHCPRLSISLDYASEAIVSEREDFLKVASLAEYFEKNGNPCITGFKVIDELAEDCGFAVKQNHFISDLAESYELGESRDSSLLSSYSVCSFVSTKAGQGRSSQSSSARKQA